MAIYKCCYAQKFTDSLASDFPFLRVGLEWPLKDIQGH